MEAREDRDLSRLKKQLSKLDLLILDELGYVPAGKLGSELLFDVISTAYERLSLIVSTRHGRFIRAVQDRPCHFYAHRRPKNKAALRTALRELDRGARQ